MTTQTDKELKITDFPDIRDSFIREYKKGNIRASSPINLDNGHAKLKISNDTDIKMKQMIKRINEML